MVLTRICTEPQAPHTSLRRPGLEGALQTAHHCRQAGDVLDRVLHLLLRHLDQHAAAVVLGGEGLGAVPGHPGVNLRRKQEAVVWQQPHGTLPRWEEQEHLHLGDGDPPLWVFVQHSC